MLGTIAIGAFALFNLWMLVSVVSVSMRWSEMERGLTNNYERAVHSIGVSLGMSHFMTQWGMGALILGLFVFLTRGLRPLPRPHSI